jgi:DNA-binding phage protein
MAKKNVRRSPRTLTAEEKSRMRGLRLRVEAERDTIVLRGREVFADHERMLSEAISALKHARQSQGLSLQDVAERMGTDRANVHRLESVAGNPTMATLMRYAQAVGQRMVITLQGSAKE